MKVHELKCWPAEYLAIVTDKKTAEFRRNDRDFRAGDVLHLRQWVPEMDRGSWGLLDDGYTHASLLAIVTNVVKGPAFGVPDGYAVLSIRRVELLPDA